MTLFDHVALALDFSETSQMAARAAFRVVEQAGVRRLTVVHAAHEVVFPRGDQPEVTARLQALDARIHEAAKEEIQSLCESQCPASVVIDQKIGTGQPKRVIPALTEEAKASVLMIGTHSRRGVRRWLAGSIAESTIRRVQLPVLVFHIGSDGIEPVDELSSVTRILIAVDPEENAEAILKVGMEAAQAFQATTPEVVLLAVKSRPFVPKAFGSILQEYETALDAGVEARVSDWKRQFESPTSLITPRVEEGEADEVILDVAQEIGCQLIVIGRGAQGSLGSCAAQVLRESSISVLVVPT